jgi:glycosyltransferase involved in cell wall biosynthesis
LTKVESHQQEEYPLVSIIVITYNSSQFVLETLESAKAQTYGNLELIISDDSSTDDTVEICKKWLSENKERFVNSELITAEKNTGISANCNRGVKAAKGEWVKLIAGDDCLIHDCIYEYVKYAYENNASVLHSNVCIYKDKFKPKNLLKKTDLQKFQISNNDLKAADQYKILLRTKHIYAASLMIKKSVIEEVGFYNEEFKIWEDRPLLLEVTKKNIKLYFVNIFSAKYRIHQESIQKSNYLISNYTIQRNKYYKKLYLKDLFFLEKITFLANYYLKLFFYLMKLKNSKINNNIYMLFTYPFRYIKNYYRNKYEMRVN